MVALERRQQVTIVTTAAPTTSDRLADTAATRFLPSATAGGAAAGTDDSNSSVLDIWQYSESLFAAANVDAFADRAFLPHCTHQPSWSWSFSAQSLSFRPSASFAGSVVEPAQGGQPDSLQWRTGSAGKQNLQPEATLTTPSRCPRCSRRTRESCLRPHTKNGLARLGCHPPSRPPPKSVQIPVPVPAIEGPRCPTASRASRPRSDRS